MAWVLRGTSLGRFLNVSVSQKIVSGSHGKQLLMPQIFAVQTANISGRALRDNTKKRPPPYPYEKKGYRFWNSIFDKTSWRFDENSKIIVVEGPIAVGKTTFAKEMAEDLDMYYLPECNMDMLYVNAYGFDMRELDSKLPESCQSYDIKKFYLDPNHQNTAAFQINMYHLRYSQYIDALAHVMNTGQGVVMERSAYSDFVFLEAMYKFGYVSRGAKSVYYDIVKNTIDELMRPHLIVYLDIPVSKVMERISKRNRPFEVNSKVLTAEYLSTLEDSYKKYLKEASVHSELLVYDWSNFGDVEVVVEDIERIDFDQYGFYDTKLKDWRLDDEDEWCSQRVLYTSFKDRLLQNFSVPRFDVPELLIPAEDAIERLKVYDKAPGNKYSKGFNTGMGDKNLLFKLR